MLLLLFSNQAIAKDMLIAIDEQGCVATIDDKQFKCMAGNLDESKEGVFPLRDVYVRTDKILPESLQNVTLRTLALHKFDGWGKDPRSNEFNKRIDLTRYNPTFKHEKLYRKDDLYNIVIIVGNNEDPVVPAKGRSIFVHTASDQSNVAEGDIGFNQQDLLEILPLLNENSRIIIVDENAPN